MKQAQAARDSAKADLKATQNMVLVRAPRAGRVLTLRAAAGERLQPGETILTLLPNQALWLRAAFYGSAANRIRMGMSGIFAPAGGGATIPVKARAVVGALRPDGGRTVSLVATDSEPGWLDGEAGTVTTDVGKVTGVAVPTSALILDQAQWWIVVHTAKGNEPQRVVPGPRRGALTLIEHGLVPGTAVVVANAYPEFHRGISAHYQPPD
jgi:multidrug efflux pump subunit AcrA (membrane-fusion protein)